MGSVVIDAVNHFFHPTHHAPDPLAPLGRSPAAARPTIDTASPRPSFHSEPGHGPMSVAGGRAVSSHAASQAPSPHHPETSQHPQSSRSYPRRQPSPDQSSPRRTDTQHPADGRVVPADTQTSSPASASSPSSPSGSSPAQSTSSDGSSSPPSRRIVVKDLAHIQTLANNDMGALSENSQGFRQKSGDQGPQYEISGMPIEHIIEMVAGLLTKITTANDMQHEHLHRQMPAPDSSASMSPQTNSVLAFHGKNIPSITILSYLNRINKYCPTSYEVFLSLLVYFDRMTEKVNSGPMQNLREMSQQASDRTPSQHGEAALRSPASTQSMEGYTTGVPTPTQTATPPLSGELEKQRHPTIPGTPHSRPRQPNSPLASPLEADTLNLSHFFVVDSFNIHRLVIAGVTCASKFFSDIFYTNSRYAKVGGLPLAELNHLELQFLLLNDFRLSIPVEEMEAYGTMLVEFYAREVLAQRQAEADNSDDNATSAPTTA